MKILLVYSSRTGNTERVANEIYDELNKDYEVNFKRIEDLKDSEVEEYKNIIVGFWIDQAYPDKEPKAFIESLRDKNIGLFGTIGADPNSYHGERTLGNLDTIVDSSNNLIAKFLCNGKVDENLLTRLKSMNRDHLPPGLTDEILDQMIEAGDHSREPNEEDFKNARNIFKEAFKALEN
ncbi:MAG: flavodoxin family protein [Andreesenia angusta]|nr:flavodoxin family protein [Andreesenia angusta]